MKKLTECCVIVSVRSSAPSQTRENKEVTAETNKRHGAGAKAGKYMQNLYPNDNAIIKQVTNVAGHISALVADYSVGGMRDGEHLLPITAKLELETKIATKKTEWEAAVEKARGEFDAAKAKAQADANGLYRDELYPKTADDFMRQFKLRVDWLPVPDESHFIFDLAEDELSAMRESTARQMEEVRQQAREEVWTRLTAPVRELVHKLTDYQDKKDKGERTSMHDTIITNIKDIVALVPKLKDITADYELEELAAEVAKLTHYSADTLKDSRTTRSRVADQAKNILTKLEAKKC